MKISRTAYTVCIVIYLDLILLLVFSWSNDPQKSLVIRQKVIQTQLPSTVVYIVETVLLYATSYSGMDR